MDCVRGGAAVFDDVRSLERAVFGLEVRCFDRVAFSILAREEVAARKLGHRYRSVCKTENEPRPPRETFFSRVSRQEAKFLPAPALASVGFLALAGAGAGAAALIAAGGGAIFTRAPG